MSRHFWRFLFVLAAAITATATTYADGAKPVPDLADYHTPLTAKKAEIVKESPAPASSQPGYLGVSLEAGGKGELLIRDIDPESPAAKAGLLKGDVLQKLDAKTPFDMEAAKDELQAHSAGSVLQVTVLRDRKPVEVSVTLGGTSRPLSAANARTLRGLVTSERDDGFRVERVQRGSTSADAGLRSGDVITKVDGIAVGGGQRLGDVLGEKDRADSVKLTVHREGKDIDVEIKLPPEEPDSRFGWDTRNSRRWDKDVYRLAAIPIEFPDAEHNPKITAGEWEKAIFSRKTYTDTSATGQRVFGSLNDYYHELSCGKFRVEGKAFKPVKAGRNRTDYSTDRNRSGLLTETLDKLLERDGKDALKDIDGIVFIYSGGRVSGANRGSLFWPHRANVSHQNKRWPYFIVPEGGERMANISVMCHEFGHMLGLPDLYARPENPGSEGVGAWCAMSNQVGNGRPQHFGAWCKEQLGWLKPAVIDPTVKQKLILAPVEDSSTECFKVLVRRDGSEYLLLENRTKKGWDRELPGEGLLIWHVVDGRPLVEESHGISGPSGPRTYLSSVPYPSKSNNAFTPYTTPSSRSQKGGGLPIHITNIRRLPDGRVSFWIGYEFF
jgi:M6 family metalloprotease-like protein